MTIKDFTHLTDLASRALGGSVSSANDELFAQRENLIRPEAPFFDPHDFGHKGKVYDGWETRRRRDDGGHDWAIVRLAAPGIVHGVVVDTAYFKGNYPPFVSVEAAFVDGYPSIDEVMKADWQTIVAKSPADGDTANLYEVADRHRWTHVRLSIYPDGGVARFRVHGKVVQDPRFLGGTVDLLAAENGASLTECSDAFYSSPANIILPGRARNMGEGWENSRRRGGGNDFAIFELAAPGVPRHVEVDTSYYVGNAPGWIRLSAVDSRRRHKADHTAWTEILPRTAVQPDTRHRFLIDRAESYTHLRLDVYPDGGLSRLRLFGELDAEALDSVDQAWQAASPFELVGADGGR
jgi:allantoicase